MGSVAVAVTLSESGHVVAIHQPNFFPWLGFFHKIAKSDTFVILDDVRFSRGSWGNRVRCLIGGKPHWITAPIDRSAGNPRSYNQIRLQAGEDWRGKVFRTLEQSYRKAPYWSKENVFIYQLITDQENNLADYNLHLIHAISERLGIFSSRIVRSSLWPTNKTATDRLIFLTKAVGGNVYLCGGGADGYQENEQFEKSGVHLRYQDFKHPGYPQVGALEFVPGLSVIDALLNVGTAGTRSLLGL